MTANHRLMLRTTLARSQNAYDSGIAEFPQSVQTRIKSRLKKGQGARWWIFTTAVSMNNYRADSQVEQILDVHVSCSAREKEITNNVFNSRGIDDNDSAVLKWQTHWPAADYATANDFALSSPVSLDRLRPEHLIQFFARSILSVDNCAIYFQIGPERLRKLNEGVFGDEK